MAYHFMVIMSHYGNGYRIGWHYSSEEKLDKEFIRDFMNRLKNECGEVQFGVHKLSTDSTSISSVKEKDSFFEDVIFTSDIELFIKHVAGDQNLTAYDVSKFILSIFPVSHLKLQKLLYYIYAEYLKETRMPLFEDPIVSYKYGPVVEDVFQKFKSYGSSIIDFKEDDELIIMTENAAINPSFTKIITSKHGLKVAEIVIRVLKKYGKESPFDLVNKTHKKGGPWERVYQEGKNNVITDKLILDFHHHTE